MSKALEVALEVRESLGDRLQARGVVGVSTLRWMIEAIPYSVYDLGANTGWVSVGIDHDTPEFAIESIYCWWRQMGRKTYPEARELLITTDRGGSNGSRTRLWKVALQQMANATGLKISVCHLPPGTSKWNKIEHRMFCHIARNWRGRPLESLEVVVNLIASTTTTKGLRVPAALDTDEYPTGVKIDDATMASLHLIPDKFHGDWNYALAPSAAKERVCASNSISWPWLG